jgi:hypothetical protein
MDGSHGTRTSEHFDSAVQLAKRRLNDVGWQAYKAMDASPMWVRRGTKPPRQAPGRVVGGPGSINLAPDRWLGG